jgi:hypothetical protein
MRLGNVLFQWLQNESPYMIATVITYVGLRNYYNRRMYTVNSEYNVANRKYYHLSYTHLLGYINCYYEYRTHNKTSLNSNAH